MRSGISHLNKKMETVRRENVISMQTGQAVAEAEAVPTCEPVESVMDDPRRPP